MAKGLDGYTFRTPAGETNPAASHGKTSPWVDLADAQSGIAILDHPSNPRHPPPWYLHSNKTMLFFSPSPLFNETIELAPQESISFRYQIIVHSVGLTPERIDNEWRKFSPNQPVKQP